MIVLAAALLVLAWARASRKPWSELGFVRPGSWAATVIGGIAFGIAFKLVMKAIVMPLLGADPVNQTYHYLAGNTAALPGMLFVVIAGAGFGEEVVYRAFFFDRLKLLFGWSTRAKVAVVVITSVVFGAVHYFDQGLAGAQQATIVGLVLGGIFAATQRIWFAIIAHAAFDVTAVLIIYFDLEHAVAQSIIR